MDTRDVPPGFFAHYPGMTACAFCDALVKLTEAHVEKREITPYWTEQEHFCGQACADKWKATFHAEE